MKTTLVIVGLFVLCSVSAFGQVSASISATAQPMHMGENTLHADYRSMASEQSLIGVGTVTSAQGERPLWEFGPVSEPVPLGDVARAYRKEKLTAKKAEIIFEKQGTNVVIPQ